MPANSDSTLVNRQSTDLELVDLAKAGCQDAYVELCNRHRKLAFMVIHRIMKNREDSEDVLQDSLLKAYLHLNGFDGRAKFSTWLTRISINSALMALRKKSARPTQSLDELTELHSDRLPELQCSALDPEARFLEEQLSVQLKQAIQNLPPLLRGVITLRHAGNLSVAEVAVLSGISVSAAKSRLQRARLELLQRMGASGVPQIRRTPFQQIGSAAYRVLK
jgi:RNA polymerase sigma-70 factor (ECF subfamily)